MESNWFEGPTEHQAQSFTKLDTPGVVRAGQARQWERGCRNIGGQTVGHTHLGGWRMEDGAGMQRKLGIIKGSCNHSASG